MSIKLTKKQTVILDFIKDFIDENGFSPSYREIMNGVGLSSVSAVAEHIDNLIVKGAIEKGDGEARSLKVVDLSFPETVALFKRKMITVSEEEKEVLVRAAEILGIDLC